MLDALPLPTKTAARRSVAGLGDATLARIAAAGIVFSAVAAAAPQPRFRGFRGFVDDIASVGGSDSGGDSDDDSDSSDGAVVAARLAAAELAAQPAAEGDSATVVEIDPALPMPDAVRRCPAQSLGSHSARSTGWHLRSRRYHLTYPTHLPMRALLMAVSRRILDQCVSVCPFSVPFCPVQPVFGARFSGWLLCAGISSSCTSASYTRTATPQWLTLQCTPTRTSRCAWIGRQAQWRR